MGVAADSTVADVCRAHLSTPRENLLSSETCCLADLDIRVLGKCKLHLPAIFIVFDSVQVVL